MDDNGKKLASWIPEDGSLEWALYVQDNYSTEYFKPVDLLRAGMIIERNRLNKKNGCKDIS